MISDMHVVFLILGVAIICFFIPRFRSDLVAVASLLALQLTGQLTVSEAFAGFSNTVVIMIAALFIVGEGVFQTGLAHQAARMLVKWTGNSEFKLSIFMMMLVALLSAFMSNVGTVALLLPVVISLCRQMHLHPGKLLMPLAFASSMGGVLTLIGTAPNLIASQSLINYGYKGLSFFAFTPVGAIILFTGIAYLWVFGRRWLDKPQEKEAVTPSTFDIVELIQQYQIAPYIAPVIVPAGHRAVGKTLKELQWPRIYDVTVLEVLKGGVEGRSIFPRVHPSRRLVPGPNYTVETGDVLIVFAERESLNRLIEETGLRTASSVSLEKLSLETSNVAEVILTPRSRLINGSLQDIHFRDKYGLTVLAISHQYKEPGRPLPEDKLSFGDSLLVHGKWKDIDLLSKEKSDIIVLRHTIDPPAQNEEPIRSAVAGLIVFLMMLMMVLELIPAVSTVVIAAMLMVITGCVRHVDQAYRSINWQTVVLIASMLPMATAMEKTGGIAFISNGLISSLGAYGPSAVLAGLYIVSSVFSQFISNTATAVLLFPVAILTAQQMGVNPEPMVMAVAFSASMAFATPVATPPNAMVMAAGKYTFLDFLRVGVPLQIIITFVAVLLLPLFFPF